jgi:hypothetical protein
MRFMVKERLRWGYGDADDLRPKGRPFEFDGSFALVILWIGRSDLALCRGHSDFVQ